MDKRLDMPFFIELRNFLEDRLGPGSEVLAAEIGGVVREICWSHGYYCPNGPYRNLKWNPDANVQSSAD
jgi:hypothetical protein